MFLEEARSDIKLSYLPYIFIDVSLLHCLSRLIEIMIGYNINVMRQSADLVVNLIIDCNFAFLFLLHAGWPCIRLSDGPDIKLQLHVVGAETCVGCCLV